MGDTSNEQRICRMTRQAVQQENFDSHCCEVCHACAQYMLRCFLTPVRGGVSDRLQSTPIPTLRDRAGGEARNVWSPHTLAGVLRQIAAGPSVASLSRFLAQAPWSAEEVVQTWINRFQDQMTPLVRLEVQAPSCRPAEATRAPETRYGRRVLDWGRLNDGEKAREEDGWTGAASLHHRGQARQGTQPGGRFVSLPGAALSLAAPALSPTQRLPAGRRAQRPQDGSRRCPHPHLCAYPGDVYPCPPGHLV